jgi:DMSO reductase anchor subunit
MKTIGTVQPQNNRQTIAQNSVTNLVTRVLGVISLVAIIVIHALDLPGKLSEVPYLGYAYMALMVGSALAAILIIQNDKRGWWLGSMLALGSIIAYVLNRTVGLPLAMEDIGNWGESLGVYSLVAEAAFLAVSGWALTLSRKVVPEISLADDVKG